MVFLKKVLKLQTGVSKWSPCHKRRSNELRRVPDLFKGECLSSDSARCYRTKGKDHQTEMCRAAICIEWKRLMFAAPGAETGPAEFNYKDAAIAEDEVM